MPFLDAHAGTLLVVFAVLAVAFGVTAQVLAVRLLLGHAQPANDEVYRRSFRIRPRTPRQIARGRGRLYLIS
jgi:hypothetical protein